jgi:hypothetical protein
VDVTISTHARILWPAARRFPHQDAVVDTFGHNEVAKPPHTVDIAHMYLRPENVGASSVKVKPTVGTLCSYSICTWHLPRRKDGTADVRRLEGLCASCPGHRLGHPLPRQAGICNATTVQTAITSDARLHHTSRTGIAVTDPTPVSDQTLTALSIPADTN